MPPRLDRRDFLALAATAGLPAALAGRLWAEERPRQPHARVASVPRLPITLAQLEAAEALSGLSYTPAEREMMLASLESALANYGRLRAVPLPNHVPPAFRFDPTPLGETPKGQPVRPAARRALPPVARPATEADWAFASAATLGRLVRSGAVTARQLAERALARCERFDPQLKCVVTLTSDRALEQADRLDAEAKRGKFRGPLHGVPYGAKDLFAVPGYPTTWGSPIYREQQLAATAAVVERLDAAGAVLVAKTTLGEFAQGDVWFGGQTKNPWNLEQGSSGSSAGSASAVAAGLVPFALGTETLGSIVSPSTRCGVSGLRPTFGRVSRHGAMALSWTMDKVGPIARTAEDLALVFAAIHGADPRDPTTRTLPFAFEPAVPLGRIRIGVHQALAEPAVDATPQVKAQVAALRPVLDALVAQGAKLMPITWPEDLPAGAMRMVIDVEAAAAFEELTRSNADDRMVQQTRGAWPNTFRAGHLIPAVQYVQANRVRTLLIERLATLYRDVDVIVAPTNAGSVLTATNLSGHPTVVVPSGFAANGAPQAITFVAALWREDLALRLAAAWQSASEVHRKRPSGFA